MLKRRDGFGFAVETGAEVGASGQVRGKNFDRNVASEASVARAVDLAHAASAGGRQNLVGAELGAGRERHAVAANYRTGGDGRRRIAP
jgi:hypothetical protein